jgi:hypothetical protein
MASTSQRFGTQLRGSRPLVSVTACASWSVAARYSVCPRTVSSRYMTSRRTVVSPSRPNWARIVRSTFGVPMSGTCPSKLTNSARWAGVRSPMVCVIDCERTSEAKPAEATGTATTSAIPAASSAHRPR